MPAFIVSVISCVAWIVWLPATILENRTRGDCSAISLFPTLPFFPATAAGIAFWLQACGFSNAVAIIGVLHALLLATLIGSIFRSYRKLKRRETASVRAE